MLKNNVRQSQAEEYLQKLGRYLQDAEFWIGYQVRCERSTQQCLTRSNALTVATPVTHAHRTKWACKAPASTGRGWTARRPVQQLACWRPGRRQVCAFVRRARSYQWENESCTDKLLALCQK